MAMGRNGGRASPYVGKDGGPGSGPQDGKSDKTARYRLIAKGRAGNTSGQWESQQHEMQKGLRDIGYKGGFGTLPPKLPKVNK
jgi:hypothetical protein